MNHYHRVHSFQKRKNLSDVIEKRLDQLFDSSIKIFKHGVEILQNQDQEIMNAFRLESSYDSPTALSIQYLPDYVIYDSKNNNIYYLDVKHSVTPLNYAGRMKRIQSLHPNLLINKSNVGIIAREALYAYRRFYPETIILYFSTYNQKIAMAQFAKDVKMLYAYGWNERTPLEQYEIGSNHYFDFDRNPNAKGSRTPHTNVYLDSFDEATSFFARLGIQLQDHSLQSLKNEIMNQFT